MPAQNIVIGLLSGLSLLALASISDAQQAASVSDAEYTAKVMTAAPPQIVQGATIVRTVNGVMQTLKKGTNDFTCMENSGTPMCMDPNAMEWAHALRPTRSASSTCSTVIRERVTPTLGQPNLSPAIIGSRREPT
jgi:hypothetical protein